MRFVMRGCFIMVSLLKMVRFLVVRSLKGVIRNVLVIMVVSIHFLMVGRIVIIGVMIKLMLMLMLMLVSVRVVNNSMVCVNCVMIVSLEVLALADDIVSVGVRHMWPLNVHMFVICVRVLLHLVVRVVVNRVVSMFAMMFRLVVLRIVMLIVVTFKFLSIVRVRVNVNMVIVLVVHIFMMDISMVGLFMVLIIVV